MNSKLPPIYFYIPHHQWPSGKMPEILPENPDQFWPWVSANCTDRFISSGKYTWTLQTYLHLKATGFPCELTATMPAEGIVLSHRSLLPNDLKPTAKILMVCIQGDKRRHPYAQIHLVQNPQQETIYKFLPLWQNYYIHFWPQNGIIPRDFAHGERFRNICFFGRSYINLAPELKDSWWKQQFHNLGLNFQIVANPDKWHDYSNVDAILAVRSFRRMAGNYGWKPATKLYNSWLAGVPAILGCESAYRAERKSELDYIEVSSPNELLLGLKRLRDDVEWRHAMVANGNIRAEEIKPATITNQWCNFITDVAVPTYESWCTLSNFEQQNLLRRSALIAGFQNGQREVIKFCRRVDRALSKQLQSGKLLNFVTEESFSN
jgi:hypothetical protein